MEPYLAGAGLLGLAYLYSSSQQETPPPVVLGDADSYPMSIDLIQAKQALYGGRVSTNLPVGLQQRSLASYSGMSTTDIFTRVRQDYAAALADNSILANLGTRMVNSGQVLVPTPSNGRNIQVLSGPMNARALIVEPYSNSGYPSNTTAVTTTGFSQ